MDDKLILCNLCGKLTKKEIGYTITFNEKEKFVPLLNKSIPHLPINVCSLSCMIGWARWMGLK